jgi:hypothetical protein
MQEGERLSLEGIRAFLAGSEEIGFKAANRKERVRAERDHSALAVRVHLCGRDTELFRRAEAGASEPLFHSLAACQRFALA